MANLDLYCDKSPRPPSPVSAPEGRPLGKHPTRRLPVPRGVEPSVESEVDHDQAKLPPAASTLAAIAGLSGCSQLFLPACGSFS
jgi:hypothetical protein